MALRFSCAAALGMENHNICKQRSYPVFFVVNNNWPWPLIMWNVCQENIGVSCSPGLKALPFRPIPS